MTTTSTKSLPPDPDDHHVAAAVTASGTSIILIWNFRGFPAWELRKHGLRRENPDTSLVNLYEKAPELVAGALAKARRNLTKTRVSALDFVAILKAQRLTWVATKVVNHPIEL